MRNIRKRKNVINDTNGTTVSYLRKDCVNVISIPVPDFPWSKKEIYLAKFAEKMSSSFSDFQVIIIPK